MKLVSTLKKVIDTMADVCVCKYDVWELLEFKIKKHKKETTLELVAEIKECHMNNFIFFDPDEFIDSIYDILEKYENKDEYTDLSEAIESFYNMLFQMPDQITSFWDVYESCNFSFMTDANKEGIKTFAGAAFRMLHSILNHENYKEYLIDRCDFNEDDYLKESDFFELENIFLKEVNIGEDLIKFQALH